MPRGASRVVIRHSQSLLREFTAEQTGAMFGLQRQAKYTVFSVEVGKARPREAAGEIKTLAPSILVSSPLKLRAIAPASKDRQSHRVLLFEVGEGRPRGANEELTELAESSGEFIR